MEHSFRKEEALRILTLFKARNDDDPAANKLLMQLRGMGYNLNGIRLEHVLRVERPAITTEEVDGLSKLFCHPLLENLTLTSQLDLGVGPVCEVSYQRAWTDPELDSILHGAEALGIPDLEWVRLSTRYQLLGASEKAAKEIADRYLYNSQTQTIIRPGEAWITLRPQGEYKPLQKIDIARMSERELLKLSDERRLFLSIEQLSAIQGLFQRSGSLATDAELETFGLWSDHCFHTTWKRLGLLQAIRKATKALNHPLVLRALDGNAGVMLFYDGWALVIKGESHISPTSFFPYGGIMTKHGGIIRDILFMAQGAWPWGGSTIMGICNPRLPWKKVPKGALHPKAILTESIRGTKDYTNPMGIPMMWSQYMIHPNNVKCFALGHSVGIMPKERAKKQFPHAGDFIVLIGLTGMDGIHGATVSSGAMTSASLEVDSTHVQVGMPIEERKFMEAIPVLRDANCIRESGDCGAMGIASATGEMGTEVIGKDGKKTSGLWVNLAWVPLKCKGMAPWQIWISESQERGIFCVIPEKLPKAMQILADFGVRATVIGIFTDSRRCQVIYDPKIDNAQWINNPSSALSGEIAVDLPYSFISKGCPLPKINVARPKERPRHFDPPVPANEKEWIKLVKRFLGHFNISDQTAAAHQFDQTVQGKTVIPYIGGIGERMQDDISAVTPLLGRRRVAGTANAVNQFYAEVDPAGMGRLVFAQAAAKLVAAGFSPRDIVANTNVYTPKVTDHPGHAWRLKQLVKGFIQAETLLGIPIISGKDSSSGTFIRKNGKRIDAPITLDVFAMGRMPDVGRLIPKPFQKPGDLLVVFHPGLEKISLGGSVFFDMFGERGDMLPEVDLEKARRGFVRYHAMLKRLGWSEYVHSRSVIADGGLIRRVFEMSIGSGLGCSLNLPKEDPLLWLFGELNTAILFATYSSEWRKHLGSECLVVGHVTEDPVIRVNCRENKLFSCPTEELAEQWTKTFTEVVK